MKKPKATTSPSRRTSSTTSSNEVPRGFEDLQALGERLVTELQRSAEADTLARWMAHHLADLLQKAEGGSKEAGLEASSLILQLWAHRDSLPGQSQPFRDYKSVLQVIATLDLQSHGARYFRWINQADEAPSKSGADTWLTAIKAVDQSARVLIQFCIQGATQEHAASAEEWIHAKDVAEVEDDDALLAIRVMLRTQDIPNEQEELSKQLAAIKRAHTALSALEAVSTVLKHKLDTREKALRGVALAIRRRPTASKDIGKVSTVKRPGKRIEEAS